MDRYIHYSNTLSAANNNSNNMLSSPTSNQDSSSFVSSSPTNSSYHDDIVNTTTSPNTLLTTSTSNQSTESETTTNRKSPTPIMAIHPNHNTSSGNIENVTASPNIPLPPSSTIETSSEPPRTLWMGDLDPNFDELTIMEIWAHLGKKVIVKLIRAKKNLLIPCSINPSSNETSLSENIKTSSSPTTSPENERININGVSFIDPSVTPLHHAGYCFVEFETQNDALFALSLNAKQVPNFKSISTGLFTNPTSQRTFRLNWASGATLSSSIPTKPEYSLFVGDLSPIVTEADLLILFQKKFKSVKTVRVMTDPITGASRCFGFVRFGNENERARALIEMNGVWCQGRCLRVAFATPRNAGVSPNQNSNINPNTTMMMTSTNKHPSNYYSIPSPSSETGSSCSGGGVTNVNNDSFDSSTWNTNYATNDPNNTTIFIGGLNSNKINEFRLIQLFQPFGNIISVKIPLNKNCAFIKFQTRIDSEAAMQGMQGFIIDGSPIRLSWGKNNNTTTTTANTQGSTSTSTTTTTTNNNNNNNIHQQSNITTPPQFNNNISLPPPQQQQQQQAPAPLSNDVLSMHGSLWNDPVSSINYSNQPLQYQNIKSNQMYQGLTHPYLENVPVSNMNNNNNNNNNLFLRNGQNTSPYGNNMNNPNDLYQLSSLSYRQDLLSPYNNSINTTTTTTASQQVHSNNPNVFPLNPDTYYYPNLNGTNGNTTHQQQQHTSTTNNQPYHQYNPNTIFH